jgi:hypothetical protein
LWPAMRIENHRWFEPCGAGCPETAKSNRDVAVANDSATTICVGRDRRRHSRTEERSPGRTPVRR